jgi:hypothetical protein
VRVDIPTWGSRNDIVPWGLTDWWEYGGITQQVWLEASPKLLVARADVVPHLDGADVSVVLENRGNVALTGSVSVAILPTTLDSANLMNPDPRSLIEAQRAPVATGDLGIASVDAGGHDLLDARFAIAFPDLWTAGRPALYVARVTVRSEDGLTDELYETFGLGEAHDVLVARRLEELQHRPAGPIHQRAGCRRGRVGGMGVAKQAVRKQVGVFADLAFRVQPARGVVEEDVAAVVQAGVFGRP